MSDHGFYIASSYGVFALALVIELWVLRRHRARALEQARTAREEDLA